MCDTANSNHRPGVKTIPVEQAVGTVLAHDITLSSHGSSPESGSGGGNWRNWVTGVVPELPGVPLSGLPLREVLTGSEATVYGAKNTTPVIPDAFMRLM